MRTLLFFFIVTLVACQTPKKELTAQEVIDNTMRVSGSDNIENATISFNFRDKRYTAIRNNGTFSLTRSFDSIADVLTNKGFQRFIDGNPIELSDSLATVYSNSVNAVHYFSVLPYGLNDEAVRKKQLPSVNIQGQEYYKIQITFSENGGGKDHEDVFIYWIGKEDFMMDYMAYSFHTDGGGMRFRVVKNQHIVNGIRFVDVDNYKPKNAKLALVDIDRAFENMQLEKLSEIVLEDLQVVNPSN